MKRTRSAVAVWLPLLVALAAVAGLALLLTDRDDNADLDALQRSATTVGDSGAAPKPGQLPDTPDYHSLLVAESNSRRIFLGTHAGLFVTDDGGLTWNQGELVDRDAMNLVQAPGKTLWSAGHNVLVKSMDGGETWTEADPTGLPHLDVHGFAADPVRPERLYAAIAGQGLFRSTDGGESFGLVSEEVGGAVFGLAVTPSGSILAADASRGVFVSEDGGKTWTQTLDNPALGIAVNPRDSKVVLAAGPLGVFRSTSGGKSWDLVLPFAEGAGPLAWSPSEPRVAYAIGFDKSLYRSDDLGATWAPVTS